jgi:hypothetical protein
MDKKSVNLVSLIRKLIKEYEKNHEKLIFSFKKKDNHFVFLDINEKLLEVLNLKASDIIGRTLSDIRNLIGNYYEDVGHNYDKAWQGQPIFYYGSSASSPDILFVVSLNPVIDENGNVHQVNAHCVPINKHEENELRAGLSSFGEHESIPFQ